MRDDDFSCFLKDALVLLILGAIVWLMTSCRSSRAVTDRETRDSVVYTYKTIYRDSLRVKDSTVFIYQTFRRDSVVLKVDKATGEVLSKDTWHWNDTNRYMGHASEVASKTEKSDSAALKDKGRVVVSKTEKTANLTPKTHYARVFMIGMLLGVLLSVAFRYRKKIITCFSKMC